VLLEVLDNAYSVGTASSYHVYNIVQVPRGGRLLRTLRPIYSRVDIARTHASLIRAAI
jgi:hypothetical protein